MNSIIDLNTAANITFATQSSYSINLGNVTGNGAVTVDRYEQFAIPEQANLVSVSNAVRDILIDVSASAQGVINSVSYIGSYANIGVLQVSPFTWRVSGIRDVNRWDEAFANMRVAGNSPANYNFVTTVNDQAGNTRTWGTAVTVLDPPQIVANTLIYNEDQAANIGSAALSITGNVLSTTNFTLYANIANTAAGFVKSDFYSIAPTTSLSVTGNVTTLNSTIGANRIQFQPSSDLAANVANVLSYNIVANVSNVSYDTALANIQIGNSQVEFSITTPQTYNEDEMLRLAGNTIVDTDVFANTYTVSYTHNSGATGAFFINGVNQGVGNSGTITGNRATVNAANISYLPFPDNIANVGLGYNQSKTTTFGQTVEQASNVAVTLTVGNTHNQTNFATTGTYDEDTFKLFNDLVADTDALATSYTISLQQTAGNVGQWYLNGSAAGSAASALVLSNSRANVNSANIQYLPAVDNTGNITIVYNQSKINSVFGNIVQVTNLAGNYTIGNTNPEIANMIARTYYANTAYTIFASSTPQIQDGPDYGQTYTISLTSALGQFGNSYSTLANTYTFTGNLAQTNSNFANIIFAPPANQFGNGTFNYTQIRNGVQQANITANLTGVNQAANTDPTFLTTVGTQSWSPTVSQRLYLKANVALVGGGGSAANVKAGIAGGGGAGGVTWTGNIDTLAASYSVTVGSGGTYPGGGGGSTTGFGNTASGGQPGLLDTGPFPYSAADSAGGASGAPTSFAGGTGGVVNNVGYGGSGGGASSAGTNLNFSNPAFGGNGVTILGSEYARGGDGWNWEIPPSPQYTGQNFTVGGGGYVGEITFGAYGTQDGQAGQPGRIIITFAPKN